MRFYSVFSMLSLATLALVSAATPARAASLCTEPGESSVISCATDPQPNDDFADLQFISALEVCKTATGLELRSPELKSVFSPDFKLTGSEASVDLRTFNFTSTVDPEQFGAPLTHISLFQAGATEKNRFLLSFQNGSASITQSYTCK